MMFCAKCGKEILDGAKFCTNCGNQLETDLEAIQQKTEPKNVEKKDLTDITDDKSSIPTSQSDNFTLSFFKKKAFMGMVYKKIQTDVIVDGNEITFKQMVGKKVKSEQTFNKADIQSAKLHSSLEIWSIIAVVLNAALAFFTMEIKVLIPIVFWLWFGYIKEARILTSNGQKIIVPFEGLAGQGDDANKLLALCNNQ